MKKTFKKAVALISALSVLAATSVCSMSTSAYYDDVFYENNITDIEISNALYDDEYITFKDSDRITMFRNRMYRMNYVVGSSVENVSNEYLGISDDFAIRRIDMGETCLYSVMADTREEMNELFESASALYKSGKIKDAYTLMNIGYSPMEYSKDEGLWVTLEIACGAKMVKYLNKEPKPVIEGDINDDNTVDVRDCADLASKVLKYEENEISAVADFNIDGKINVRDAAALANYLLWYC